MLWQSRPLPGHNQTVLVWLHHPIHYLTEDAPAPRHAHGYEIRAVLCVVITRQPNRSTVMFLRFVRHYGAYGEVNARNDASKREITHPPDVSNQNGRGVYNRPYTQELHSALRSSPPDQQHRQHHDGQHRHQVHPGGQQHDRPGQAPGRRLAGGPGFFQAFQDHRPQPEIVKQAQDHHE